jgi:acetyl-CoA carboxylase/biotin carboxylase 1
VLTYLHSRTGRMEAKGCAKAMVWKNARRHFYWALRARLARTAALDELAAASPDTPLAERNALIDKLAGLEPGADPRAAAAALEALDLSEPLAQLRADGLADELARRAAADRTGTVGGLVRFIDSLSDEEKVALRNALQTSGRGGPPSYVASS